MENWTDEDFVGGHPALDFLNTVSDEGKTRVQERLVDWPAFGAWSVASGLFASSPGSAGQDLSALLHLRETGYAVMRALANGDTVPQQPWGQMTSAIKDALSRADLTEQEGHYVWSASPGAPGYYVLDRIALAFEDLFRTADLSRLRQCGRCSWLFLDHGRGRGRRWCKMRTCGNRAKVEAFRKR